MRKLLFIQRSLVRPVIRAGFSVVGLSVLLLIPYWVNAQVYHPLVQQGASWSQEETDCDGLSGSCEYNGGKFFLEGDTLIQSVNYSLLKFRPTYYYSYTPGLPPTFYGWNISGPSTAIGALREDSSRKIWLRLFPNSFPYNFNCPLNVISDKDTLLYDFNLQVGDTILSSEFYHPVISEIDSIQLLNGEWRKRYVSTSGDDWIEGIGSIYGLFKPYEIFFECGSTLTCHKENNELLFEQGSSSGVLLSCDSISVGIQNINSPLFTFEISPNPASDFLTINFSSLDFSTAQIKITDVLGRNLFSDEIKSNQPLQISTRKFSGNNLLLCQFWHDGKLVAMKKVLIQK